MADGRPALGDVGNGLRLAAAGLATVAVIGTAGCGGSASTITVSRASPSRSATTTSATSTGAARRPPRAPGKPVGRTQLVRAGSATMSVTVTGVLDPLSDSGAARPPGTRAVGVRLMIRNDRGATYDSTASGDVSVIASSGMGAPLFIRAGVCQTPLTDFESLIGAGETRAGCVGFAVPRRARILGVRFSPHSRRPGSVTWR